MRVVGVATGTEHTAVVTSSGVVSVSRDRKIDIWFDQRYEGGAHAVCCAVPATVDVRLSCSRVESVMNKKSREY